MNYFDIIIALILVYAIYKGYTKGFIFQFASLAALVFGIWGAIKLSNFVAIYLEKSFEINTKYLPVMSFAIVFLIILILVFLLSKIIQKIIEAISLGFINRLAGVIFSCAKVILILSVFMVFFNRIDNRLKLLSEKDKEKSIFYYPLSKIAPAIFPYLNFENIEKFIPPNKDDSEKNKQEGIKI